MLHVFDLQSHTPHCSLGLKATSHAANHATPTCRDEPGNDASLLACSALKGFPCESVFESQRLAKCLIWQCTLDKKKFPEEMASYPTWQFGIDSIQFDSSFNIISNLFFL